MNRLAAFAGFILRLAGWRVEGQLPREKKFIVIVAPHTSNWDFFLALALGLHWKAIGRTKWFGKHSIFKGWPGTILRALGGIPIDRSRPQRVVQNTIEAIRARDDLILALSPEGTRKWTDHWKSGFYLIAIKTNLPVALAFINYRDKTLGITRIIHFTGSLDEDWAELRKFYQKEWARYPADFSEVRPRRRSDPAKPAASEPPSD